MKTLSIMFKYLFWASSVIFILLFLPWGLSILANRELSVLEIIFNYINKTHLDYLLIVGLAAVGSIIFYLLYYFTGTPYIKSKTFETKESATIVSNKPFNKFATIVFLIIISVAAFILKYLSQFRADG